MYVLHKTIYHSRFIFLLLCWFKSTRRLPVSPRIPRCNYGNQAMGRSDSTGIFNVYRSSYSRVRANFDSLPVCRNLNCQWLSHEPRRLKSEDFTPILKYLPSSLHHTQECHQRNAKTKLKTDFVPPQTDKNSNNNKQMDQHLSTLSILARDLPHPPHNRMQPTATASKYTHLTAKYVKEYGR